MIASFFLLLIGAVLGLIGVVLSTVTSVFSILVPDFISTGLSSFFETVAVFQGVLPLVPTPGASGIAASVGIIDIFGYAMTIALSLFTVYLILLLLRLTPFLNMRTPTDRQ